MVAVTKGGIAHETEILCGSEPAGMAAFIEALNRLRNKLIAAGRYTDAVDEMLIKVAKAKPRKFGLWGWRF